MLVLAAMRSSEQCRPGLLGPGPGDTVWLSERPGLRGGLEALPHRMAELTCPAGAAVAATACLWRGRLAAPGPASLGSCWFSFCVSLRGFSGPAPPSRAERASSLLVTLGVRTLCVCGSRAGVWKVTFVALAGLLGGTFSFWERRRTEDLPVTSGGENRKSQFSGLLLPATFSSVKICRLILPARCRAPGPRRRRRPLRAKDSDQTPRPPRSPPAAPADSNTDGWLHAANQRRPGAGPQGTGGQWEAPPHAPPPGGGSSAVGAARGALGPWGADEAGQA